MQPLTGSNIQPLLTNSNCNWWQKQSSNQVAVTRKQQKLAVTKIATISSQDEKQ